MDLRVASRPAEALALLRKGTAIPAHPPALDAERARRLA